MTKKKNAQTAANSATTAAATTLLNNPEPVKGVVDVNATMPATPNEHRSYLAAQRARFVALADERYRAFTMSLNPSPRPAFGVRSPMLRAEAKRVIAEEGSRVYLDAVLWALAEAPALVSETEWTTLGSVLMGRDKHLTDEEHDHYFEAWLSQMDGWGVCDTHGSEAHFVRARRDVWQRRALQWVTEVNPAAPASVWKARVALVIALAHFRDKQYVDWARLLLEHPAIERALKAYAQQDALGNPAKKKAGVTTGFETGEGYYLSMVVAWCWTVFYVLDPVHVRERVVTLTKAGRLDAQTALRVVSKVRDSLAVSAEEKAALRAAVRQALGKPV